MRVSIPRRFEPVSAPLRCLLLAAAALPAIAGAPECVWRVDTIVAAVAAPDAVIQRGGKPWTINYSYSGGILLRSASITVTEDGSVTVTNRFFHPGQALFSATSDEMAKISAALEQLNLSGPPRALPPATPMPDAITASLEVTYDGRKYQMETRDSALLAVLNPIMARGQQQIVDNPPAQAGPFRLGRKWEVQLEVRDAHGLFHGEYWNAVWTRRGDTNEFDAVWRNTRTNEEVRDTVELDSAERGHVVLRRSSQNQRLEGAYQAENPSHISGTLVAPGVSGCAGCPGLYWRATIEYQ
jgi:hypothetical protein